MAMDGVLGVWRLGGVVMIWSLAKKIMWDVGRKRGCELGWVRAEGAARWWWAGGTFNFRCMQSEAEWAGRAGVMIGNGLLVFFFGARKSAQYWRLRIQPRRVSNVRCIG